MEHALIAKFSSGRPHVSVIEKEFRGTWKTNGRMIVSDLDGRHILVILETEKDVISALTQAPRRVGTSLFRLFKWTPDFHLRKESTIITVWVRFPRLRPDLFNDGVLKCLCQPFGRFLDSDDHTKNRTRCAFARCCVEIDLAKALPSEIWIDTGDGSGWWQEIFYEGNLKYCAKCRLHGHNLSECRKVRDRPQDRNGEIHQKQGVKQTPAPRPEPKRQEKEQDWIPVISRKSKQALTNRDLQKGEVHVGGNNPFNPILVEEEGIVENLVTEVDEEGQGKLADPGEGKASVLQRQNRIMLSKSNSADHLAELMGKEHMDVVPIFRSSSMSDIPAQCKESRLEVLREEFNHYHLIAKHLKKTKEETLQRLKLMELRQSRARSVQEDIQQYMVDDNQLDQVSQVPETQMEKPLVTQLGENSQKQKKGTQVGKKHLTRASKKQNSPRR